MLFISTADLKAIISDTNVQIIDVREPYERAICHVESIHIPMGEISDRHTEISGTKNVVLLCKSGKRAEAIANFLETEHQFTNLSVLSGGILAWIEDVDTHLESY